jgi:Glyoxalase-like domain
MPQRLMLRFLCCAILAGSAMAQQTAQQFHIDHVTVAGKNVEAMEKALSSVSGITAQYGGPHSNHATEMALASFADGSYLELIAIQPKADPTALAAHYWHKFMEADAGPCAWAIRPADFNVEVERLRKAGIAVTDPRRAGRTRPDGVQLDWATAQVGPTNGGFFPFMIHDFTPRDNRAFPSGKPTTTEFTGIAKVVIAVRNLDDAIARYRQAYSLESSYERVDPHFGAKFAIYPSSPVVLAAPLSAESWLSSRLDQFGEAPCAFVLSKVDGHVRFEDISWLDSAQLGWRLGIAGR